jgi:hypothetical protein
MQTRFQSRMTTAEIRGGRSGTAAVLFSQFLVFPTQIIVPSLLHALLSPPREICYSPVQAARNRNVCPVLGALPLTMHLASLGAKAVLLLGNCNIMGTGLPVRPVFLQIPHPPSPKTFPFRCYVNMTESPGVFTMIK